MRRQMAQICARYSSQDEVGKGAFQELDQVAAARQLCKFAERATSAAAVPGIIQHAFEVCVSCRVPYWEHACNVCWQQ